MFEGPEELHRALEKWLFDLATLPHAQEGALIFLGEGSMKIRFPLWKQFADCLEAKLSADAPPQAAPAADSAPAAGPTSNTAPATPKAVGGFGLGLRALWAAIKRFFARLFGRRDRS